MDGDSSIVSATVSLYHRLTPMFLRKRAYPQIVSRVFEILFPTTCINCSAVGSPICSGCFSGLEQTPKIHRDHLSLFQYSDKMVRQMLWELKYKGRKDIARIFAPVMREQLDRMFPDGDIMIIPIPLSRRRRWSRGFNQAEILAREITHAQKPSLIFTTYLYRTKHTPPQTLLKNKSERLRNIVGSFAVSKPEKLAGNTIVVIDDVTTTGATLNEAVKVLKQSGAKKVIGFAIAH